MPAAARKTRDLAGQTRTRVPAHDGGGVAALLWERKGSVHMYIVTR